VGVVGFLNKTAFWLVGLAVLLYVLFFVQLGQWTLYEHFCRIAKTPEARELGNEVDGVVESTTERARVRVVEPVTRLMDTEDGR